MRKVIVIQFVTLDGVVEDPDGSGGLPGGGWTFRCRPGRLTSDLSALGPVIDTGVLLFGGRTREVFSRRSDPYAETMNRVPKTVVSRSAPALDAWAHSSLLEDEPPPGVAGLTCTRDVVVVGGTSVVHALAAADAVDEYRLLVVPTALGAGARLFVAPVDPQLTSIETVDRAVLACYDRTATR